MVNYLDYPYLYDPYDYRYISYDSYLNRKYGLDYDRKRKSLSTDSCLSVTKALIDTEIDYHKYKRRYDWLTDSYTSGYLSSLARYYRKWDPVLLPEYSYDWRRYLDGVRRLRRKRFFEEECLDTSGLTAYEKSLLYDDKYYTDLDAWYRYYYYY